ncbi:hypothetical protein BDV3_005245 [Batrachochytrium dendrobatidis]|nr:S-adenosylmethionine-dependent methyltransferase [Batrachochytrium dendrobatidis]KAK5667152.1 S-adenosylmethionine-dependent methyltransferase [Batrachochytrium dendrobatidis]
MNVPTPDISHISRDQYQSVYEPAEDTFLLLDALEKDRNILLDIQPTIALEIGSGSGCVTAFLGALLGSSNTLFLCTDINDFAAKTTLKTGQANKIQIDAVITSFTSSLHQRICHNIDVLIFNPPYVVTTSDEVGSHGIEAAWAGGIDGREVIDKFLPLVSQLLSKQGQCYLVLIKENRPEEIMQHMLDIYNLHSEIVLKRKAGFEGLFVVRFYRSAI